MNELENLKELIDKAKDGDIEARDKILVAYSYIIDNVLIRFRFVKIDDSAKRMGAILGLISAIQNFDTSKGDFGAYAYYCAYRRAQREMNADWLIRLPNEKINSYMTQREQPYEIMSISNNYDNAKWTLPQTKDGYFDNTIHGLISYDKQKDSDANKVLIESILELNPIEQDAIYNKYGFTQKTLIEIGEKHGKSYEWVRVKAKSALKKLKFIYLKNLKNKNKQKVKK